MREVIAAAELATFVVHCESHPVDKSRCSRSQNCSIRPVWLMLERKINDVLDSVALSDLLFSEALVRERVGLPVVRA